MEHLYNITDTIIPGETVLFEYRTSYIPEFLLKFFVDYSRERGLALLVDDNFDTLNALIVRAKTLSIAIEEDRINVLKTGGKIDVGNVIGKVKFDPDPRIYLKNYEEASLVAFQKLPKPVINLVLGLESFFLMMENSFDVYRIILSMQRFTGNPSRKAFYIINRNIMKEFSPTVLPELERIGTTVVELTPYPTGATVKITKALNRELIGREFKVDVQGWL